MNKRYTPIPTLIDPITKQTIHKTKHELELLLSCFSIIEEKSAVTVPWTHYHNVIKI